jgi:hypothetical protein
MMRKVFSVALMATLACAFGLVQNANAGVTIDVLFQDATVPSGITIDPLDTADHVGPGCVFTGYYGASVATGRCMDVILKTTDTLIGIGTSVTYDNDQGLVLSGLYEWKGVGVVFDTKTGNPTKNCTPPGGVVDKGGIIQSFDCIVPPPNTTTTMVAGTYRIGTIIWDTSGTTAGQETVAAYIDTLFDGAIAIIGGNVVDISSQIVVGSHILTIIPEPGTASLLGLGLVGLVLAGRRSR